MHYYKKNIGDYHKKAGRLNMLEHGAYTLLLDACYDRERFPTEEEALDWCWARTEEEMAAVKFVLSKFFVLIDGRYVQQRVADEVEAYHAKSDKNRQIAIEREEKRRKRKPVEHETCTERHLTNNQEPLTNTTTTVVDNAPEKKSPAKKSSAIQKPDDVDEQTWADWLQLRKTKKAPVTETVLKQARSESEKAGIGLEAFLQIWCARGSQGLQADWIKPSELAGKARRPAGRPSINDFSSGGDDDPFNTMRREF